MKRTQQGWAEQVGVTHSGHTRGVPRRVSADQQTVGKGSSRLSIIKVAVQGVIVTERVVESDSELVAFDDIAAGGRKVGERVWRHVEIGRREESFDVG